MIRFSLIAVVSADGFIARRPDEMPAAWTSPEEQAAFREIMKGISWSFLGRATHDIAPNAERRRVVFTRRVVEPVWANANQLLYNPTHATLDRVLEMARVDGTCGILGGTAIYDHFLALGRVDEAEVSIEPVTFGSGLPLFSAIAWPDALARLGLTLVSEEPLNDRASLRRRYARSASPVR